jgi:hypothetical protein
MPSPISIQDVEELRDRAIKYVQQLRRPGIDGHQLDLAQCQAVAYFQASIDILSRKSGNDLTNFVPKLEEC